jgi:hypothetical protein
MKTRWLVRLALLLAPAAFAEGCSLINSYDDVKTGVDSGEGDGDQDSGLAADTSSADGDQTSDGEPDVRVNDAGSDAPVGVVVVAARGDKDGGGLQYVLAVLDPATGRELSREPFSAIASYFDGQRDLWYVIEAPGAFVAPGGPFVGPTDDVFLHVRQLDTHTGQWTELSKVKIPPPISGEQVAVLKERLAYVGFGASNMEQLIVLKTTSPTGISADASAEASTTTTLPFNPIGLVGTRNPANGGAGGLVTLIQQHPCDEAGVCSFTIQGASIVDAPTFRTSHPLSSSSSPVATVGWGSYVKGGSDVFVTTDGGTGGQLERYAPLTNAKTADPTIGFNATSNRFRPLAVSDCFATAFVSELNAPDLFAIPLTPGGVIANLALGHAGSAVVYEPYTNTLFAPASGALTALAVTGTLAAPQLAERTTFRPPLDIKPYQVATRQPLDPLPFTCPAP